MEAMIGWTPRQFVVEKQQQQPQSLSVWVDQLSERVARVHDVIEMELSQQDFIDDPDELCAYAVGDPVMLLRPGRHKKLLLPFERGWVVQRVVSPSTVEIAHAVDGGEKIVNVELLKADIAGHLCAARTSDTEQPQCALRDRSSIRMPSRYS